MMPLRTMKTILLWLLVPVLAVADILPAWPVLKLRNGTEYKDVKVTLVEPGAIKVVHAGGVARIPASQLPDDVAKQFVFDEVQAALLEAERQEQQKAAREKMAGEAAQARARDAEWAARQKLKYRFMSFRFERGVNGGAVGWRHEKGGVVGETGLITRALVDRPLRPAQQSAYVAGGTDYERPVFIEGSGPFAEGEIIGGFVAELGTVTLDGRVLRRWVLQPGRTLQRN